MAQNITLTITTNGDWPDEQAEELYSSVCYAAEKIMKDANAANVAAHIVTSDIHGNNVSHWYAEYIIETNRT